MKCIALSTKQVSENILLEIKCIYKSASAKDSSMAIPFESIPDFLDTVCIIS